MISHVYEAPQLFFPPSSSFSRHRYIAWKKKEGDTLLKKKKNEVVRALFASGCDYVLLV